MDAAAVGGELCAPVLFHPAARYREDRALQARTHHCVAKSLGSIQAGGVGMSSYNANDAQSQDTDNHWLPTVHVTYTQGAAIKAYIAAAGAGATARIVGGQLATFAAAPSMASFSSRGPDAIAGDIIKPDVTAPGVQVLSAASPFPDPGFVPGEKLFQAISGTSMASPHVAGAFALIKQVHPDWSPAMAKSASWTTAYQDVCDSDLVSPAGPFAMGAGHLHPGGKAIKGSAFQPGLVYDAGSLDYLAFLCEAGPEVFANPEATPGFLRDSGFSTDPSDLNLASIGIAQLAGSQTVTRTVTSVAPGIRTFRASVEAPPGTRSRCRRRPFGSRPVSRRRSR